MSAMQPMWACGLRQVSLDFIRVLIYRPTRGWTVKLAVGLWRMVPATARFEPGTFLSSLIRSAAPY